MNCERKLNLPLITSSLGGLTIIASTCTERTIAEQTHTQSQIIDIINGISPAIQYRDAHFLSGYYTVPSVKIFPDHMESIPAHFVPFQYPTLEWIATTGFFIGLAITGIGIMAGVMAMKNKRKQNLLDEYYQSLNS